MLKTTWSISRSNGTGWSMTVVIARDGGTNAQSEFIHLREPAEMREVIASFEEALTVFEKLID